MGLFDKTRWETVDFSVDGKPRTARLRLPTDFDPAIAYPLTVVRDAKLTTPDGLWLVASEHLDDAMEAVRRRFPVAPTEKDKTNARVDLTISVDKLRNDFGSVRAALFFSEIGFPDKSESAVATATASPSDGAAKLQFTDLAPGVYALTFLHDENNNGKLDTSFGFPTEGFGTSNNPKVRMGPPKWSEARFLLTVATLSHERTIHTVYL